MKNIVYLIALVTLGACATTKPTLKNMYIGSSARGYYQGCWDKGLKSEVDTIICKSGAQKYVNEITSALQEE